MNSLYQLNYHSRLPIFGTTSPRKWTASICHLNVKLWIDSIAWMPEWCWPRPLVHMVDRVDIPERASITAGGFCQRIRLAWQRHLLFAFGYSPDLGKENPKSWTWIFIHTSRERGVQKDEPREIWTTTAPGSYSFTGNDRRRRRK